jgi:hypothetical protein
MKTTKIICEYCKKEVDKNVYEVTRCNKLGKPMYCSLSCGAKHAGEKRNIKNKNIEEYNKNPIKCKCCMSSIPYDRRTNEYCSSACAAKVNNVLFPKKEKSEVENINPPRKANNEPKNKCLFCGNVCKKKFCSCRCDSKHRIKLTNEKIERGEKVYVRQIRRYLIEKRGNKCEECGWDKINLKTGKCPIEMEHVDGNHENNLFNNLKLLCPNCHSLTPTYKGANRGNGRHNRMKRYNEGKSF